MATTLRQLYFDENMAPGQIAENFHNLTGFELAVSEGSMTKNDPHLSALRRDEFEGRAIDIGPHVKIGNRDPKLLRIHYHADPTTSRIIVGHCGGHLESAGSRFR